LQRPGNEPDEELATRRSVTHLKQSVGSGLMALPNSVVAEHLKDHDLEVIRVADDAIHGATRPAMLLARPVPTERVPLGGEVLVDDGDLARANPNGSATASSTPAAVIARSGRRTWLRLADSWPWAAQLAAAFHRLRPLAFAA
jgi:hypothetical protein